jgi:hypothetical protein
MNDVQEFSRFNLFMLAVAYIPLDVTDPFLPSGLLAAG